MTIPSRRHSTGRRNQAECELPHARAFTAIAVSGESPLTGERHGDGNLPVRRNLDLLDKLASGPGLPHLPAEFSRADIYADHD
jgi:hypothetical protein